MLVISLTDCPPALRGDLSKWLQEIDTGVYVGQVSARVREELWQRTTQNVKAGRAILVYSAPNEQGMDFRIHNADWTPIDFDGLKLMLRPHANTGRITIANTGALPPQAGYSLAAKMRMAKRCAQARAPGGMPDPYVIIDLETTGLSVQADHIIELGAIRICGGVETDCFEALVCAARPLPAPVCALTGLSNEILSAQGRALADVLPAYVAFLADMPIVSHHVDFDLDFLRAACRQAGIAAPANRCIDTLALSRRYAKNAPSHQLACLMQYFQLPYPVQHRALADCRAALLLLNKLIEIRASWT